MARGDGRAKAMMLEQTVWLVYPLTLLGLYLTAYFGISALKTGPQHQTLEAHSSRKTGSLERGNAGRRVWNEDFSRLCIGAQEAWHGVHNP